ncbi:MAG: hypothetical protein QM759_02460 [Terricaulis sp.]
MFFAVAAAVSCSQPPATAPQAPASDPATLMETVDIASHSGQSFEAFTKSAGMERFGLEKLDLSPDERARVIQNMAISQPSRLISGGGAEALVFLGCARGGCADGLAVLAFGNHGETFVGVHDAAGTEQFIPDDRMEALLRLNSAARRWDDPETARPEAKP